MSSHRGDGIFNPKPIPDLAGDPAKLKVSRDPQKDDLRNFIHGLITQEFDGPRTAAGSARRARRLCPQHGSQRLHGARNHRRHSSADAGRREPRLSRWRRTSYASGDQATGRLLIGAARSMLGMIDERFQLPGGERSRTMLRRCRHRSASDRTGGFGLDDQFRYLAAQMAGACA